MVNKANDQRTDKVAFAAALLGILFTIQTTEAGTSSLLISIFGHTFTLKSLYYLTAGVLSVCVYVYGLMYVSPRITPRLRVAGDVLYLVAFSLPAGYMALFLLVRLVDWWPGPSGRAGVGMQGLAMLMSIGSVMFTMYLHRRSLHLQSMASQAMKMLNEKIDPLLRAKELLRKEYPDLALLEAWKAVEQAIRITLAPLGIDATSKGGRILLDEAKDVISLSSDDLRRARNLLDMRNRAAHGEIKTDIQSAEGAMKDADHLLNVLSVIEQAYDWEGELPDI